MHIGSFTGGLNNNVLSRYNFLVRRHFVKKYNVCLKNKNIRIFLKVLLFNYLKIRLLYSLFLFMLLFPKQNLLSRGKFSTRQNSSRFDKLRLNQYFESGKCRIMFPRNPYYNPIRLRSTKFKNT